MQDPATNTFNVLLAELNASHERAGRAGGEAAARGFLDRGAGHEPGDHAF